MRIDNVGFDVKAMAKLTKKEFVEIHMDNDAICPHQPVDEKTKWLEEAHDAIIAANGKPAAAKADSGGTSKSKSATAG